MAELAEKQTRMVANISRSQKPMAIVGGVLALLGAAYVAWGVVRFNPHVDPRVNPGFDWPIARLAFLFDRGHAMIESASPETKSEQLMLHRLRRNMEFSTGVMIVLLRIFVGTIAFVLGLSIMTVVVERARLITLLKRLQE